jgi:hypothetical protein
MALLDLDLWLFLLRLALVGLLYLFLFQVVRALRRDLWRAAEQPLPAAPPIARLAVIEAGEADLVTGQFVNLQPSTTVGRGPHNTISLEDSFVSASHARVSLRGKRWYIEDIGSTNGTFVNHRQIQGPTPVEYGDLVEIGRVKFKLVR